MKTKIFIAFVGVYNPTTNPCIGEEISSNAYTDVEEAWQEAYRFREKVRLDCASVVTLTANVRELTLHTKES